MVEKTHTAVDTYRVTNALISKIPMNREETLHKMRILATNSKIWTKKATEDLVIDIRRSASGYEDYKNLLTD